MCILFLVFFQIHAQEQEESLEHKNYEFNTSIKMEGIKMKDTTLEFTVNNTLPYSEEGQRFKVISIDKDKDGYVYFRFFKYRNNNTMQAKYVEDGESKFFRIKKDIFKKVTDKIYPIYAGETFGVVSIGK